MKSLIKQSVAAFGCASLLMAAPASAAARITPDAVYSPWAALSAFASPSASQALCGSAVAAAAAGAAAQAATGCVLPAIDAPVAPPVAEAVPVGTPAAAAVGGGVGVLPLLLGLATLGGLAALLLSNNDEGGTQISISP
nr:hypothetical protein [uncultured Sphingomonas sp.]